MALDLFKDKLSKVPFKDEPLNNEESKALQELLENKIKELISTRVYEPDVRIKINFLGQTIGLNITPRSKNDQDSLISYLYRAYEICNECIAENKPIYLSIQEKI